MIEYTDHCYVGQNRNSNSTDSNYYSESSQNILNEIVNDSVSYDYSPDETRYYNRENAYRLMKRDSLLISTTAREQFMVATESENMGMLVTVAETIATGDLSAAGTINNGIVDTNVIENNKRAVNDIIISRTINGVLVLTASDSATLLSIAYQDPIHGGEAVYRARAILRLRIADNNSGLGASRTIKNNSVAEIKLPNVEVFPIPSTGLVYIKVDNTSLNLVKIYDVTGRLLYTNELKSGDSFYKLDISNLVSGYYGLLIKDAENKLYNKQIILNK